MKVAIVDYNYNQNQHIIAAIKLFNYKNIIIDAYSDDNELLSRGVYSYDIFFIDSIAVDAAMELALKIKVNNQRANIFYFVSDAKLITREVIDSFFSVIVKPIKRLAFFAELNRAIKYIASQKKVLKVTTKSEEIFINITDISHIESDNKATKILCLMVKK